MSAPTCATVALVTEVDEDEKKYHWMIMFSEAGKVYAYQFRTMSHMAQVLGKFFAEHGRYPFRVWSIVDGEIQKVNISS